MEMNERIAKMYDNKNIEELKFITEDDGCAVRPPNNVELMDKINEIIKWINKENKDE